MYTLSLEIINKCNLNCTYCYLGEKKNTYMSLETAQKAIDIAVHEANKQYDRTLMVYFIGGEPLMAFNLMKDAVGYTKKKCQETNLICKFSTTINGTLVTDEVIDFFVENTFEVKVSLDGPEYVQNLNRRDYAGNGSFEEIMKNLPLLRKYEQETGNQISVASVATVYKGNIIKNLIMDCQSYTKYRPNETTGGIFVSWRRKEELPTGA